MKVREIIQSLLEFDMDSEVWVEGPSGKQASQVRDVGVSYGFSAPTVTLKINHELEEKGAQQ